MHAVAVYRRLDTESKFVEHSTPTPATNLGHVLQGTHCCHEYDLN